MVNLQELASERSLAWIKVSITVVACWFLWREWRSPHQFSERAKKRFAGALAVLSLAAFFQFSHYSYPGYFHRWDVFHYYVGSKYAPELGYKKLYACTAVADAETGDAEHVAQRRMRVLEDDSVSLAGAALSTAATCKQRFSAGRWAEFRSDIAWFRRVSGGGEWWELMQLDHGFNASPVWAATGHAISNRVTPSIAHFRWLAAIDVALMGGCLLLLWWAFGWRIAALATVFWGSQAPAELYWTGGAFLRQDWLFACVLGVALLRKRYFFGAGAALAYAALVRAFPVLLFSGLLVLMLRELVITRRLSIRYRRLIAGAVTCAALLIPWGASVRGFRAYDEFVDHIGMHAQTPITNHMSLRTLFSASPNIRLVELQDARQLDRIEPWIRARRARLDEYRVAYWLTAAALLAGFAYTVWRLRTAWLAVCLGMLPILSVTDPSCYYYSLWLLAAVASRARRSLEMAALGLAATSQIVALRFRPPDERYYAMAAAYVIFSVVLVGMFARRTPCLGGRDPR